MKTIQRKVKLVVISDVHLGTYGSKATELSEYLRSIDPEILVLNGDIVDVWQFSKRYFPPTHMQVIKCITYLLSAGTKVYYITGNHDEMLRKFKGFKIGNFEIQNKVILPLENGNAWIFHGDVFDTTMKHSKWLAKLGGQGYDLLILINTFMNWISMKMGKGKISFSKKVKDSVKGIVKHINNFEQTAGEIAIENKYDYVICGHIHQPKMREISNSKGKTLYLNSGDWVENSTALEYHNGSWSIYKHSSSLFHNNQNEIKELENALDYNELIRDLLNHSIVN
jgi:UDP-2,3-diacylglucosamine pyrophosphatase LpxH